MFTHAPERHQFCNRMFALFDHKAGILKGLYAMFWKPYNIKCCTYNLRIFPNNMVVIPQNVAVVRGRPRKHAEDYVYNNC